MSDAPAANRIRAFVVRRIDAATPAARSWTSWCGVRPRDPRGPSRQRVGTTRLAASLVALVGGGAVIGVYAWRWSRSASPRRPMGAPRGTAARRSIPTWSAGWRKSSPGSNDRPPRRRFRSGVGVGDHAVRAPACSGLSRRGVGRGRRAPRPARGGAARDRRQPPVLRRVHGCVRGARSRRDRHATTLSVRAQQEIGGFILIVVGFALMGLLPLPKSLVGAGLIGGARKSGSRALLGAAFATCAAPCIGRCSPGCSCSPAARPPWPRAPAAARILPGARVRVSAGGVWFAKRWARSAGCGTTTGFSASPRGRARGSRLPALLRPDVVAERGGKPFPQAFGLGCRQLEHPPATMRAASSTWRRIVSTSIARCSGA